MTKGRLVCQRKTDRKTGSKKLRADAVSMAPSIGQVPIVPRKKDLKRAAAEQLQAFATVSSG